MRFASDAGSVLGNFDGQIRYRLLRRAPARELLHGGTLSESRQ